MKGSSVRASTAHHADDIVARYLEEMKRYPLLTRDEEDALARRASAGDEDALRELVCANLRFVVAFARRYQREGVSVADLINEGNLGLIRAAHRYDQTKGVKFISYAVWWIRQAVFRALAEQGDGLPLKVVRARSLHRFRRHAGRIRQRLLREPTLAELAAELGVSESEIDTLVPLTRGVISLDSGIEAGNGVALAEFVHDDEAERPDDSIASRDLTAHVESALRRLRPREADILRMYFGLDGAEPLTLEEIAGRLGITRERVRQIKEKALQRIRHSPDARALAGYAEG